MISVSNLFETPTQKHPVVKTSELYPKGPKVFQNMFWFSVTESANVMGVNVTMHVNVTILCKSSERLWKYITESETLQKAFHSFTKSQYFKLLYWTLNFEQCLFQPIPFPPISMLFVDSIHTKSNNIICNNIPVEEGVRRKLETWILSLIKNGPTYFTNECSS